MKYLKQVQTLYVVWKRPQKLWDIGMEGLLKLQVLRLLDWKKLKII